MKKTFLTAVFFTAFGFSFYGQKVNGVLIKDLDVPYIEITAAPALSFRNKVLITVNFGQQTKVISKAKDMVITDENDKFVKFNTSIDAINFFYRNGYELNQTYATTTSGGTYRYFILKKKDIDDNKLKN